LRKVEVSNLPLIDAKQIRQFLAVEPANQRVKANLPQQSIQYFVARVRFHDQFYIFQEYNFAIVKIL
jgi:hypothetical protein